MKDKIITFLFAALIIGIFVGACWLHFHIWKISHPGAPAWTWWFH